MRALNPLGPAGMALFDLPAGVSRTRRFIGDQRKRRVTAPVPPGGVPKMTKINQILNRHLEKVAGNNPVVKPENFRKALMHGLAMGAGLSGAGLVGTMGIRGVGGTYQKFVKERMFKHLNQRYPEIKRNPKAREYFDLIVAYAPSLMRHPSAIGDFLRRQLEYPVSSVEFIKQLADLESTIAKTESSSMAAEFGKGMARAGGSFTTAMAPGA